MKNKMQSKLNFINKNAILLANILQLFGQMSDHNNDSNDEA